MDKCVNLKKLIKSHVPSFFTFLLNVHCNGLVEKMKWVNVHKAFSLLLAKYLVIIGVVIIAIINTVDWSSCSLR